LSVANACALGKAEREHVGHGAGISAPIAAHHHSDEGAEAKAGKANCLDFCEKSSVGNPRLTVVDDGPSGATALPAAIWARLAPVVSRQSSNTAPRARPPRWRGTPPPRIAYQRWAL
jgi:hypothetical protein